MLYPESVVCAELRWEYGLPKWRALELIQKYKARNEYAVLCRLVEVRNSILREER